MQMILQDVEMRQMLWDEHLRCIPDLEATAKKMGPSRLAYITAISVVELM